MAYVGALKWLNINSGWVLLGVRHLGSLEEKFEELDELAKKHDLIPNKRFQSEDNMQ